MKFVYFIFKVPFSVTQRFRQNFCAWSLKEEAEIKMKCKSWKSFKLTQCHHLKFDLNDSLETLRDMRRF